LSVGLQSGIPRTPDCRREASAIDDRLKWDALAHHQVGQGHTGQHSHPHFTVPLRRQQRCDVGMAAPRSCQVAAWRPSLVNGRGRTRNQVASTDTPKTV